MTDAVRNFLEQDKALCYVALKTNPDQLLRAVELIDSVTRKDRPMTERKPTCQYCLADCRHTPLGTDKDKRCPVCGAAYTGPRRSAEYRVLVEAGFVTNDD